MKIMKILHRITKTMLKLCVFLYVIALFYWPICMRYFTTEGHGSWKTFFENLRRSFIVITPFAAIIFILILALRWFLAYKLEYIDKRTLLNRQYVALALEILLIIILMVIIAMASNQNEFKIIGASMTGVYLSTDQGAKMIIVDGSPIVIKAASTKGIDYDDLSNGDKITVRFSQLLETYPAKALVYDLSKEKEGTIDDIPKEVLESLIELGWLEEMPTE